MQSSVFSSATVPVSGQTPKPKEMSKATNHWLCHPSDIRNPYSIWELQLQPTATPIYTETRCNRWTAVGSHCIRSAAALLPALVNFPIARLECPLGGSLISGHFCTITWNIGRRFDRTRNIQSDSCSSFSTSLPFCRAASFPDSSTSSCAPKNRCSFCTTIWRIARNRD